MECSNGWKPGDTPVKLAVSVTARPAKPLPERVEGPWLWRLITAFFAVF